MSAFYPNLVSTDSGRSMYGTDLSPNRKTCRDDHLESDLIPFALNTSYGDVNWHPSMKEVIWRNDDVVPVSTPGDGTYTLPIFGPTPDMAWAALRRGGTPQFIDTLDGFFPLNYNSMTQLQRSKSKCHSIDTWVTRYNENRGTYHIFVLWWSHISHFDSLFFVHSDESVEVSRDAAYQCNQARTVEINNILSVRHCSLIEYHNKFTYHLKHIGVPPTQWVCQLPLRASQYTQIIGVLSVNTTLVLILWRWRFLVLSLVAVSPTTVDYSPDFQPWDFKKTCNPRVSFVPQINSHASYRHRWWCINLKSYLLSLAQVDVLIFFSNPWSFFGSCPGGCQLASDNAIGIGGADSIPSTLCKNMRQF